MNTVTAFPALLRAGILIVHPAFVFTSWLIFLSNIMLFTMEVSQA